MSGTSTHSTGQPVSPPLMRVGLIVSREDSRHLLSSVRYPVSLKYGSRGSREMQSGWPGVVLRVIVRRVVAPRSRTTSIRASCEFVGTFNYCIYCSFTQDCEFVFLFRFFFSVSVNMYICFTVPRLCGRGLGI